MKRVEQALNTPASEPMRAESRPATTMPRSPGGSRYCTIIGKAPWATEAIGLAVGADQWLRGSGILPLFARAKQMRPGMMKR